MTFMGAVVALVLVAQPFVVQLKWTNPPDRDLRSIRFQCWQVGSSDTLNAAEYFGVQYEAYGQPYIYPSSPDSIWFAVPCSKSVSQWGFRCFAVDTAGNVSGPSNLAFKTIYPP